MGTKVTKPNVECTCHKHGPKWCSATFHKCACRVDPNLCWFVKPELYNYDSYQLIKKQSQ